jgi:hypothetical protein
LWDTRSGVCPKGWRPFARSTASARPNFTDQNRNPRRRQLQAAELDPAFGVAVAVDVALAIVLSFAEPAAISWSERIWPIHSGEVRALGSKAR